MTSTVVPAGSYVLADGKSDSLEAHLGTCVGVTLCDRQAGVGGLIHLVLPRPGDPQSPWRPELYASTGLPLFIEKLRKSGAAKKRLVACVAGGGLTGPLTERDLTLDFGGRTADVVENILREEGIPIEKSEMGGYFGCRLKLDPKTWATEIQLFGIPADGVSEIPEAETPDPEEIEQSLEHVFPIPQIALRVMRMILDESSSIRDIADQIGSDQVLSARIIRYCNTPGMSGGRDIDSVDRAVMILGDRIVLRIAMAISIQDFFLAAKGGYSLCKGGLFKHSVETALVCKTLAETTGKASANLAYTAGLLHDLGKVVLDQHLVKQYPLFYQRVQEETKSLTTIEHDLFGLSHTEAGGMLAKQWFLPEKLGEVIERHHSPEEATLDPTLTCLVHIADVIMARFRTGLEVERIESGSVDFCLAKIDLYRKPLNSVLTDICAKVFTNREMLG